MLAGHFGRCCIGNTGHDGRDAAADGPAFITVIGNAGRHQQAANIGKAQAERAVSYDSLAICLEGNCAIKTEISRRTTVHRPRGMLKQAGHRIRWSLVAELQKVERGKVAGRVVQEHIFRARV